MLAIWCAPSREKFAKMMKIEDEQELKKTAEGFHIVRDAIEEFLASHKFIDIS